MVSNVRSSHESTFDVQPCLLLSSSHRHPILFCMPHCPSMTPSFLYAAYNAIADPLGRRIPQRGDRVLTSFALYFFLYAGKNRHSTSSSTLIARKSLSRGSSQFSIHIHNTLHTWVWISFPSLFLFLSTASGCSSGFALIVNGLLGQKKNHTHF